MNVYIVGIGGAGTSALAMIYHNNGAHVSGVDTGDGFFVSHLQKNGITVHDAFDSAHITDDIDVVVHSTAIDATNVELVAAREKNRRILSYPHALGELTTRMPTIAVCGTHGKTTTTALLAHALIATDVSCTALVGSRVPAWGSGAYVDGQDVFVLEADEYQNKLALYTPHSIICTSVDFDHPDFFVDDDAYKDVFRAFVARVPEDGYIVACGDDANVRDVIASAKTRNVVFYGTQPDNDFRITKRHTRRDGQTVFFVDKQNNRMQCTIALHGEYNAKNALAAWIMAGNHTPDVGNINKGLGAFTGTARRFEYKGVFNGCETYDDYAHHPQEITAVLRTAREMFDDKRLVVAFHPHTFTRTQALMEEFVTALDMADVVVVHDIYGSAREKQGIISAQDVVDRIKARSADKARVCHTVDDVAAWMRNNLTQDDVFFTLGAGDIWKVYDILDSSK